MGKLSLDNGNTYYTSYEIVKDPEIGEKVREYAEQIFDIMDSNLYRHVEHEGNFETGDDVQFIVNYLCKSKHDLVIG
jgi:hypothetical protein